MLGPSNRSAPRSCGPERSCVAKSLPQQRAAETANLCRCRKSQLKQLRDRQQNMRIEQLSGEKERLDFERRYAQHMLAKVTWRSPSAQVCPADAHSEASASADPDERGGGTG